ncbi:FtsX-like permease family protein [Dactylosporangium siamense]|uniref:ABC3 transporter permease C-terminal domain-containing protein n=1 Tax=Dactylosporangium siamense TaxID=685454 RepID=A0A919UE17_9ACTN|nr:FtsX-like permease family protein [Dactylosporangium siamense]GIG47203.1 hypothetical protein Dsi01nite_052440 [Dactylosporangium siamense]
MRVVRLGLREFRHNWRRNSIFGLILLLSIGVQLFTALSAEASKTAVERYGAAVFGYAETYTSGLEEPLSVEQLRTFNARLDEIGRSYPWFRPATSVSLSARLRTSPSTNPADAPTLELRAVTPAWRLMTPAIADDDAWRTVMSDQRLGPAILLESATAERLRLTTPAAVTVLLAAEPAARTDPGRTARSAATAAPPASRTGGGGTGAGIALLNVPVFGTYSELNKAFTTGGLVNQNVLGLAQATPRPVQIAWRCEPTRCSDTYGLIRTAAQVVGGRPQDPQRVDNVDQILPILTAQRRDGQRFAAIVVLLGMLAVAFVATAFIEVRAPQFATLRALGASRSAIGAIALLENLFTAATVAVLAAGLGLAAGSLNPDLFNQIPQVRLDRMEVPVALYAQTVALTLLIGLLTGLAPALRAYRSVRTT